MGTHYDGSAKQVRALDALIKLMRCSNTLESRLQRELKRRGITLTQLGVLEPLLHLGRMCQRELAGKMLRSGGSVTSVVDTLEGKQLLCRQRDARDRRVSVLHLTPKGRRLIEALFPEHLR